MRLTKCDRLALVRNEVNGGAQQLTVLLASDAARMRIAMMLKQWSFKYGDPSKNVEISLTPEACFLDAFFWLHKVGQRWTWGMVTVGSPEPVLVCFYTGALVPRIVLSIKATDCPVYLY